MSEQEFELYLKLLSRCLALTSRQREQISDELRDHLQERLDELARAGVSREKAVFQALDEFGDAAVLAAHFTTIAHLKRRRFLMRLSLGSVSALAAALLVAYAFWPENRAVQGPPQLFAQNKAKPAATAPVNPPRAARPGNMKAPPAAALTSDHPLSSDVGQDPAIEAALEQRTDFTIDPEPLKDAIDFIAHRFQIPILLDARTLEDASIDTSLEVKAVIPGLKLRQMLKLMLEQIPQPLGFDIEDGVLRITTVEKIREHRIVVVYDCRDLIHLRSIYPGAGGRPGAGASQATTGGGRGVGGGMFDVGSTPSEIARQFGGGKSAKKAEKTTKTPCAESQIPLLRVIRYAGNAADWPEEEEQNGPTITELDGLVVVKQDPLVHERIKRILADLRRMRQEGAFAGLNREHSSRPTATSSQNAASQNPASQNAASPNTVSPGF